MAQRSKTRIFFLGNSEDTSEDDSSDEEAPAPETRKPLRVREANTSEKQRSTTSSAKKPASPPPPHTGPGDSNFISKFYGHRNECDHTLQVRNVRFHVPRAFLSQLFAFFQRHHLGSHQLKLSYHPEVDPAHMETFLDLLFHPSIVPVQCTDVEPYMNLCQYFSVLPTSFAAMQRDKMEAFLIQNLTIFDTCLTESRCRRKHGKHVYSCAHLDHPAGVCGDGSKNCHDDTCTGALHGLLFAQQYRLARLMGYCTKYLAGPDKKYQSRLNRLKKKHSEIFDLVFSQLTRETSNLLVLEMATGPQDSSSAKRRARARLEADVSSESETEGSEADMKEHENATHTQPTATTSEQNEPPKEATPPAPHTQKPTSSTRQMPHVMVPQTPGAVPRGRGAASPRHYVNAYPQMYPGRRVVQGYYPSMQSVYARGGYVKQQRPPAPYGYRYRSVQGTAPRGYVQVPRGYVQVSQPPLPQQGVQELPPQGVQQMPQQSVQQLPQRGVQRPTIHPQQAYIAASPSRGIPYRHPPYMYASQAPGHLSGQQVVMNQQRGMPMAGQTGQTMQPAPVTKPPSTKSVGWANEDGDSNAQ